PFDDFVEMRLALEILGRQLPDLAEGRVVELEAPVAAEDGDRLVEIVERLALNLDERVVRALQGQLVGDVLIDAGEAAEGMRRDDEAQGWVVGEVEQLLLWLDQRGEHGELRLLEGAEIGVFRQAPALAQPLQHLAQRRLTGEPVLLEAPQRAERSVV